MIAVKRMCWYQARNINVLPAIVVTPKRKGVIIALKWLNRHAGIYLVKKREKKTENKTKV